MVSNTGHDTSVLDERYGRSSDARKKQRRVAWIVGGIFAAIFCAWVVWAALDAVGPAALDVRDTAHVVVDDRTVEVTFELSVEPGTTSYCAVQALNDTFAIVGWKVVEIPGSDQRTRTFTETLTTTELASTGLIYRCWLA
ncbi:DUF4307 domain-containing protein [Mycetocola manganoxydans]|uniref:DUF4307 domain-containing protein n=1 Tax=Mycetocola manganoxydans TaxID=699879 RepID=A0A3L6ZNB1_9MICO|nr:DUF4307 domain-containing protein [Mycetocola manganoxydans]RLP69379.1 DUF4307 domain-containing protein [Mycetocola manganoxydans]GHD50793.1 hypothetical protein GCM10008097_25170 [Mycetocola manganoxydans]